MSETIEFYEGHCCVCFEPLAQGRRGRLRQTCSQACRQRLYRLRHPERAAGKGGQAAAAPGREPSGKENTCAVCGAALEQPRSGRRRETCSEACRKRLWRSRNPECLMCGKRFKPAPRHRDQKFCSEACRLEADLLRRRVMRKRREAERASLRRPYWWPRRGSGYREEAIPWAPGSREAKVLYVRAAVRPEVQPDRPAVQAAAEIVEAIDAGGVHAAPVQDDAVWEETGADRVERDAEAEHERGAWGEQVREDEDKLTPDEMVQYEALMAELREGDRQRRLRYELLEDESKWWSWP